MVVGTLVILCGRHGLEVLAVYEGEHGNLRTGQEFLDNDTRTGTAECTAVDQMCIRDRPIGYVALIVEMFRAQRVYLQTEEQ